MEARRSKPKEARPVERVLKEARLRHLRQFEPLTVDRATPMREVISRMQSAGAGAALVAGPEGRLQGIFTERDYLDKVALAGGPSGRDPLAEAVETYMTPSPRSLSPEDTVLDAIRWMTEGGYRHIPLVEGDGRIVGLVSAGEIVQYIAEHFPKEVYNLPPRLHQPIRTREGG